MRLTILMALALAPLSAQTGALDLLRQNRTILDAHNCYPENGKWSDRMTRALATGRPVAIEQDLAWFVDSTGKGRVVVSHSAHPIGNEPALRDYFFERVRPQIEQALAAGEKSTWPLIVLHFDFKSNTTPLLEAVWSLLGEYEAWITTAQKGTDPSKLAPFSVKPLLVLTEDPDEQEEVFFNRLPAGATMRIFGSAHTTPPQAATPAERTRLAATLAPSTLLKRPATNYRRWWNSSWAAVEAGGASHAGEWNATAAQRLRALVNHAHQLGYWIRFYTLDGYLPGSGQGWNSSYNFSTLDAVRLRWQAAIDSGVNLIATDQYEDLWAFLRSQPAPRRP